MKSTARPGTHRIAAVIAAMALGASASCYAGEAQDFELPTLRTPAADSVLTRAEVRAELLAARSNGTLQVAGEGGDSRDVLVARAAFNLAQAETLLASQRAHHAKMLAQQPAQSDQFAAAALDTAGDAGVSAVTPPTDATEVRIDIINLNLDQRRRPEELVVISIDGGTAASQRDRAIAVRRQLSAMGIDRRQVYVESTTA